MDYNVIIKIVSLSLKGIKNVSNGKIIFEDYHHLLNGDFTFTHPLLAIYGQNGSGKTAIIEGIKLLKALLNGETLSKEALNYINYQEKELTIKTQFYLMINDNHYLMTYEFTLKNIENELYVVNEGIKYRYYDLNKNKFSSSKYLYQIIDYQLKNKQFRSYFDYKERLSLEITSKVLSKQSSLFNKFNFSLIKEKIGNSLLSEFLDVLSFYGKNKMIIIGNEFLGNISLNKLMPINIPLPDDDNISFNNIFVNLLEPSIIKKEIFPYLEKSLTEINILINSIVPKLSLQIGRKQETLMENGETGINFEIITKREDIVVPLKFESEGIKKIISITCALIALYNDESILLAIDEFDSGIHEYLLGELLDVLHESKGQLIFTSHNLRPLEKMNAKDIIFTTSKNHDRYIHLKRVSDLANLREIYMRNLILGEKDFLYLQTDNYLIKKALRKAGK